MPRGVSSTIITELDKTAFEAPIYAVRIARETGTLYWAEREVTIDGQPYEARLDSHDGVDFVPGVASNYTIRALNIDGEVTALDRAESFAGCRCELLEYLPTLNLYSRRATGYLDEITEITQEIATIPVTTEHTGNSLVSIPKRTVSASCPHHFANIVNYVNTLDFEGSECPYQRVSTIGFGASLQDTLDAITTPVTFVVRWLAGLELMGAKFKATDQILIGSEKMLVTAADDVDLSGDQEITVTRGYAGTTMATHAISDDVFFANCQFSDSACIRRGMYGNNSFDTFGGTPRNYFGGFPLITGMQWGFYRTKQGEKPSSQRLNFSGNESAYGLALCLPYGKVRIADPILLLAVGEGDFLTTFWAVSEGLLATNDTDDTQTTRLNAYSGSGTGIYVNGVSRHDSRPGFGIEQWNGQMDQEPPSSIWFQDYPEEFEDFFLGFNGTAVLVLRINTKDNPATDVSGAQITGAFDVEYGRVVRVYTSISPVAYTRKATTNPAWVGLDIRTAKRAGAGVDYARMDIQSYIDSASHNDELVTSTDEDAVTSPASMVKRWTFNGVFDQKRPFGEWERMLFLGCHTIPPFPGSDGKYKIKPLKAESLVGLPVLSSIVASSARNILWESGEIGVERSSLVKIRKSILDIPNQITATFIDKATLTKITAIVADRDAQEALGRKLGDQSRRVIEKVYSLPGTSTMEEAARWATLTLRIGEFAQGGIANNNGVRGKLFYRGAVNLEIGDIVDLQDDQLDPLQGERYYRISRLSDQATQVDEGGFLYEREFEAWVHDNAMYDDGAFTVTHFERLGGQVTDDDLMNGPTPTIDNVNGKEFDVHFTVPNEDAATYFEYSVYAHTSDILPTAITDDTGNAGVVVAGISKLTDLTKAWTPNQWALDFDIVLFDPHRGSLSPLTRTHDYEGMFIVCQIVTNTETEITFNAPESQVTQTISGMEYYIVQRGVGHHFWEQLAFTTPAIVDESITVKDPSLVPGTLDRTFHMSSSAADLWIWVACYNKFGQGRVTATPATISYSGDMPAGAIDIMAITDGRNLGGLVNARKLMISSGGNFATLQHSAIGEAQYADTTTKGMYRLLDHGHVNVRDYGARGDGSADDTLGIEIAWSVVLENGGGKLFFPAGTYRTTSNLVFSVIGSTPQGCYIEGVPGASIIKPESTVTIAMTLATESNTDGYCNSLKVSGLRIDGVNTSGDTGILVGDNAGDLSAGITLEDIEVLRFAGSGSKGIDVRNVVNARFTRVYVGRCGTNLHIQGNDALNNLPTTLLFENCQFREAKSTTGGTGRGLQMVRGFRMSFRHCLFEANDKEGVYCIPASGTDIVLWTEFDDCWFEANQASTSPISGYEVHADGTSADTVMIRLANLNFNSACASIYLKNCHNVVFDNVYPRASANSVVIDATVTGTILNWPENNVPYSTAVTNNSSTTFGGMFHAPATMWNTFKAAGAATFLSTTAHADAVTGLQGVNLNLLLQPGNSSSGFGILRDYQGNNVALWSHNGLAMERRFRGGADTVASANDLTLPLTGNYFVISGTTTINAITTANWGSGAVIYLEFGGALTFKHNTAGGAGTAVMRLAGGVDLTTANGTTITLGFNGTNWQELGRKVP